jgi:hypothetical protein
MEEDKVTGFNFLDVPLEEALQTLYEVDNVKKRKEVCSCGHALDKHRDLGIGRKSCEPGKQYCPCKAVKSVLRTSDTRFFLRKTIGGGALHALVLGVASATKAGAEVEWLVEMKCEKCGTAGPVSPVPTTQYGIVVSEASGYDALLCVNCREAR